MLLWTFINSCSSPWFKLFLCIPISRIALSFLEWKVMTNLDSIFKSRDITLPTRVRLVKAMVFAVVMYGCELVYKESWALKNSCFWTVVLEKILESPLDCKEIQPAHPKGLKAGGAGDDRGWDGRMASPTHWAWVWVSSGSWWWAAKPGALVCLVGS